mmetsp:Transcript_38167/g.89523  ORF Transcript_38167/g.89523 Transcript_38167/m.89523 type:complete len:343 (-) Transcript_38167:120-1148(-)|eukprot:CAMPEP_0178465354 /NCGR_PEP_ID=MMETSP0689_2-20121128/51318_1 /TAXON_ID=160604 /ORGANISM="Amphidinium massartii, Strain CS-259" /LENGTH=342 /DNA_ID=CAMNT_0020092291 /DNA_START=42 /DNA_END=1070 /DNA_ORIENTATION=+
MQQQLGGVQAFGEPPRRPGPAPPSANDSFAQQFDRAPSEEAVAAPLLGATRLDGTAPMSALDFARGRPDAANRQQEGIQMTQPQQPGSSPAVMQQQAHRQCVCGNYFMDDAAFCRKCGRPRPGGADVIEANAPPAAEADAPEVAPPVALYSLQVLVYFNRVLTDFFCLLVASLVPVKSLYFQYPDGWQVSELILAAMCFASGRAQKRCCSTGNRLQSVPTLAASQALVAPLCLIVSYFAGLQIYVLQVEFILGAMVLLLLFGELVLACAAGLFACVRGRETVLNFVAATAGGIALITALTMVLEGGETAEGWQVAQAVCITLGTIGTVVAAVSLLFLLDASV